MSIDSRIRQGIARIETRLPEADVSAAYDIVVRAQPGRAVGRGPVSPGQGSRRPAYPRPLTPRLVPLRVAAAAAAAALVASGLLVWLHHDRTPTDVRPVAPTPWILLQAPVGSPYNPSPRRGERMMYVSNADFRVFRNAPVPAARFAAWSPDGGQVAAAVVGPGGRTEELWVSGVAGASRHRVYLCSGCGITGLDWSPDGRRLGLTTSLADGRWVVRIVTLATGRTEDALTSAFRLSYPRWSPDGTHVSVVETHGRDGYLVVVDPAAGPSSARRVLGATVGLESADWSPDGTQLAYTAGSPSLRPNTHADLYVVNSDGSGRHRVTVETSGTRLMDVEWESRGTPFLVSAAIGTNPRVLGLVSTVTADGHLHPVGGTGIVPGVAPRLRP